MWRIAVHEIVLLVGVCCSIVPPIFSASSSEWAPSSPFDENDSVDRYTTAYLNVTYRDPVTDQVTSDRSELGKYGEGRVGAAYGLVVHVGGDHQGCRSPLVSKQPPSEPWIALIKRGNCNFEVKVDLAYRSNASAVLVYNDRDTESLDKMKLSTDANRNISAVFTYKWKGEELARLGENGTKVYLGITVGSQCTKSFSNINRTSVLFVSISFIVLMIISLAWLVFYYVQRFRYIHAKDRLSRRLCSAAKKALSKIPTKAIRTGDKEIQGDGECCAVCIEPYKTSDVLRILPCRHEFHKSCIDPWLLEHRTCPMCKMDILKHYGFIFTDSQESILIEEVRVDSSETLQRRHATLRHQLSRSNSPDNGSRSSRASTPDEMTPTLSSERSCRSGTEGNSQSPVMEEALDVGSNKSSVVAIPSPKPGHGKTSCVLQDCQLESCESPNTSPSHQKKEGLGEF